MGKNPPGWGRANAGNWKTNGVDIKRALKLAEQKKSVEAPPPGKEKNSAKGTCYTTAKGAEENKPKPQKGAVTR